MGPDYTLNFNIKFFENCAENEPLKKQKNISYDLQKVITYTNLISAEVLSLIGNKDGEKSKKYHCYAWPTGLGCFLREKDQFLPKHVDTHLLNLLLNHKIEKKCGEAHFIQPLFFQEDSQFCIQNLVDSLESDGYSVAVERTWVSACTKKHVEFKKG